MDIKKEIKKVVADFRLTHAMNEDDCKSLESKINWFAIKLEQHIKSQIQ